MTDLRVLPRFLTADGDASGSVWSDPFALGNPDDDSVAQLVYSATGTGILHFALQQQFLPSGAVVLGADLHLVCRALHPAPDGSFSVPTFIAELWSSNSSDGPLGTGKIGTWDPASTNSATFTEIEFSMTVSGTNFLTTEMLNDSPGRLFVRLRHSEVFTTSERNDIEFDYAWLIVHLEGWPLRVVSAGGDVYRIGPDSNPDGGVVRLVKADGAVYIQSTTGGSGTTVIPADFVSVADGATLVGTSAALDTDDGDSSYARTNDSGQEIRVEFPATALPGEVTSATLRLRLRNESHTSPDTLALSLHSDGGGIGGDGLIGVDDPAAGPHSTSYTTVDYVMERSGDNLTTQAEVEAGSVYAFLSYGDTTFFPGEVRVTAAWLVVSTAAGPFPLRYVSSDGTVEVTLPMVLDV